MSDNPFESLQVKLEVPDLWQQEAIRAIQAGRDVIVDAPTGAGKTFIFECLIKGGKFPPTGQQAVYTVPTRALANDKWREWKRLGWKVGIATGDLAVNQDAPVLVATLETQRERLLAGNGPAMLVIDEYQMIGDRRRGLNYELSIVLAPPETQLLLLSGSVANPKKVADWFERLERDVEVVQTRERPVPLEDIPVEALPNSAPRAVKNFWQRLAAGALLSNMGPLLIFAPHRREAEKIAKKIGTVLPDDDRITIDDARLNQSCDPVLAKLLRKRVAWHHSGLSFTERAGIVEPLAKAGQLRVVVATMGLAAGINFSMRSVYVTGRNFREGPFERQISPDELLQMFGRAGRRGMDEIGYVISGSGYENPRLDDAQPLELRRSHEMDWPTLIRKMHHAAEGGSSPFEAARDLSARLFSRERVMIGFSGRAGESASPLAVDDEGPLFGLVPMRKEMRNAAGDWEKFQDSESEVPLGEALVFEKGRYRPAESSSALVQGMLPRAARLCRLDEPGSEHRIYGLELAVASLVDDEKEERYRLTKNFLKLTKWNQQEKVLSREEIEVLTPDLIVRKINGARIVGFLKRGNSLSLQAKFDRVPVMAQADSAGFFLIKPETRSIEIKAETHYADESTGDEINPAKGSAAFAWRQLGLIDSGGKPTERGMIFSFFPHGEGLAVAAALEDEFYPIDELIWHLANLRAGHRFELEDLPESTGSERLAAVCRQAYGPVDFEGYLRLGLPAGYGEGAAEVVKMWFEGRAAKLFGGKKSPAGALIDFGPGDVERAGIEWLSLLRHIRGGPDFSDERWQQLQDTARKHLQKFEKKSPSRDLPPLSSALLQRKPQHRLSYAQIRTQS